MEKQQEIVKNISISPNYMDENIIKNVIYILKNKYEKTCEEDYGLIMTIDSIKDIQNVISKDSCSIIFEITFIATTIKPEKNMSISFVPTLILPKGIFGKLYDNINLFIPESSIISKGWVYKEDSFIFSNKEKEKEKKIDKKTKIDVLIKDIKFNTNKYNCICDLK